MRSTLSYHRNALAVVLAASVCLAIANAFRALHAPFVLEIAQAIVFAVLIEMAVGPALAINSLDSRRDRKRILALFSLVGLCAIAVLFVFAFLASSRAAAHVFFPFLFPCVVVLVGDRLLAARGLTITQTLIGPATRVLIVICVSLVFLAANLCLTALFRWTGVLATGNTLVATAVLSCDLFLKLASSALYAATLRESFLLVSVQPQTNGNG